MCDNLTRRGFLRTVAATGAGLGVRALAQQRSRPNIVLIMVDDMGYSDLGCYGSEIATPHLDGMARKGIRFSQFYNTPRCCPSRAALLTGLYPHQAGVGHMNGDYGRPGYLGRLNDRCVTIAEALGPAGYHTMMVGKWHVGAQRPYWPRRRGFHRFYGCPEGGGHYFKMPKGRTLVLDDDAIEPPQSFYLTDLYSDHAVEFLDEVSRIDKPFFLYLAYTAPHWPLHALPDDIAKYRGRYMKGWDAVRRERHARQVEMGLLDRHWPLTPRDPRARPWARVEKKKAQDLKMAVYAAQVDRMDQGVGRVLAKLRDMGAEENTLVMFLSDNGGCAEQINRTPGVAPGPSDSFLSYGLPWANASNTPFRLYKHWVHEGGIATSFIAQWPARIRSAGSITHEVGHVTDIMATCLDVAGAAYPRAHGGRDIAPLEGSSLRPIFEGGKLPNRRPVFWEHEGNRAVRLGKWKLVSKHPGKWELYDMAADRTELHDCALTHAPKARELKALYDEWAARANVEAWPVRRKKGQRGR